MKPRFLYRAFKARYRGERKEIAGVLAALSPGDIAVDAGAHKGAYTYWMRRAVGAGGKVFAFEPQPGLAAYLTSASEAMRWSNVVVRECALSDAPGTGTLHVPRGGSSQGASLSAEAAGGNPEDQALPCRLATLDDELASGARVAFLKVDVEGHELPLFRGAARILARDAPVVLFECEARHLSGHSMGDVFTHLQGLGYEGSFYGPRGLRPLSEFDPAVHQRRAPGRFWEAPGYCNNFLFAPRRSRP